MRVWSGFHWLTVGENEQLRTTPTIITIINNDNKNSNKNNNNTQPVLRQAQSAISIYWNPLSIYSTFSYP